MSKKEIRFKGGLAYSTDSSLKLDANEHESKGTLSPALQKLKVMKDSKQRAGKVVTVISNFIGKDDDLDDLAKTLKTKCGTGGSVKDGDIIIQGDVVDKVKKILSDLKYGVK
jgi:translation initiation factor 1